ncbi:DUF1990 family protein [Amnibacterium sp.]|uniref:DUF1990 family protein n=1 Tax=Amnibacterium sp. TaxID=1872496 RepID=UPI003F7BD7D3
MSTVRVGPMRRGGAVTADSGMNYAALGATSRPDVVPFPPSGFHAAEYRHRIGSGARRFDLAGRALMTWGALRHAGFQVDEVRAEPVSQSPRGAGPLFLEDGTPWITPGMTARLASDDPAAVTGRVKVLTTLDEPGRIGYVFGTMTGSTEVSERFLLVEHGEDDAVHVILRSLWEAPSSRLGRLARAADARQRKLDERIVRALHPSFSVG